MKLTILGAGLSGISLAYFLQDNPNIEKIDILEKDDSIGGLCRSIKKGNYIYDIGPHILFSKNKKILAQMISFLEYGKNNLIRSNQIIYKNKYIQYPFENDLSKLPKEDLQYCIQSFINNPYREMPATNMLQFFLKTFGEGITNTYLRPYNEKIWKFDPSYMNTYMVERIPQPSNDEILRSAKGETIQGYLHQLYFYYPQKTGISGIPEGIKNTLNNEKCQIIYDDAVCFVKKNVDNYTVKTKSGCLLDSDIIVSTIPVPEMAYCYEGISDSIKECVKRLHYNSIKIVFIKIPYDACGNNFTFTIPDKKIIFHRISKMDFLGKDYHHGDNEATYIVEITYKENDTIDQLNEKELKNIIAENLVDIHFAKKKDDVSFVDITSYKYAYVIYDIEHSNNMKIIRNYYKKQGIYLHGRFGNFEYWNMDKVFEESKKLASKIIRNIKKELI